MERIYVFLPSIVIIACIAGATRLYLKLKIKSFGDNFKSVKWHEKNKWKVIWTVGTPSTNIWAPAVEELIFRAPLIIAFSAMSSFAWYGVLTSSGLFALLHWFGKKIWMTDILSARKNNEHKTDGVMAEMNRLHQDQGKAIMIRKVLHVVLALPVGILAGYYGIKYQSIWVSFGIHFVWNIIMPMVFPLLLLLGTFAFFGISSLWDRVMWKWRRSW